MQEIWKKIECSNGHYEVSNMGRIRCIDTGNILKTKSCRNYYQVYLAYGINKYESVHRLVAKAFVENPYNFPVVNHKDEDKHNNCADNLEWCTQKYNVNYGENSKLKNKRVIQYDAQGNALKVWDSMKEAAEYYNIKQQGISRCCRGGRVTCGKYMWSYATLKDFLKYAKH